MAVLAIAAGLVLAGGYTLGRGLQARQEVTRELRRQHIVTPEDASIPGATVTGVATARSMAQVIEHHVEQRTGGLSYAEMGRFASVDRSPKGTSDEAAAVKTSDGRPMPNPLRAMAFEASALRTGLYTSVMAIEVANLVIGVGALIIVVGAAFSALGLFLTGIARARRSEGSSESSVVDSTSPSPSVVRA